MANLTTEEVAKLIQRKLGLTVFLATLGDENGVVYDNPAARNGMVRIRYTTAAGLSLSPVVRMRATLPPDPGTSVLVGYDKQGELAVLEGDYNGMMAQGINPLVMNAADPNVYGFTNTVSITTLLCFPRTTPNVNSTDVGVKAWIYVEDDVWHYFPGELVALSSFIPATGLHRVVGLYLKTDDTIETFASTAKNVLDPLTITGDVQEVHNQITAGSKPVWFWRLYGDQTAILDKDSFLDGRQFINSITSGGGGSFDVDADSGVAETVEDGDTLIIAGGAGIDTVVSAPDTVTIAVDSSVVTLTGSQTLTNKTLTTPTITDFTNAQHDHLDADDGGTLSTDAITTGTLSTARLPIVPVSLGGLGADNAATTGYPKFIGGSPSFIAELMPYDHRKGLALRRWDNSHIEVGVGTIVVKREDNDQSYFIEKYRPTIVDLAGAGNWIGGSSTEAASSWISVYMNYAGDVRLHNKLPNYVRGNTGEYVATMLVNQSGWNGTAGSGLNATSVIYDNDSGEELINVGDYVGVYGSADTDYSSGRGKGSGAAASVNNWSWARITAVDIGTNTLTLEAGHQIAINDNDRLLVVAGNRFLYRLEAGDIWWRWLGAIFNNGSSNLVADRRHNFARTFQDNDTNYTISATAFPNAVDTTNLAGDILTNGGNLKVEMHGATSIVSNSSLAFDVSINGVLLNTQAANTAGIQRFGQGATGVGMGFPVNLAPEITVLPGAHHAEIHAIRITANNTLFRGGSGSASALEFKMSEVQDTS